MPKPLESGQLEAGDEVAQSPGARANDGRPGPLHEELWNAIMAEIHAAVESMAPTLGTVLRKEGGQIVVEVDDEDGPREVPIPRKRGEQYDDGDRVKITRLRGGYLLADGTVSTREGRGGNDAAVGDEDIHTNAIKERQLDKNSVTNDQIAPGSVNDESIRGTNVDVRITASQTAADSAIASIAALNASVFTGQNSLSKRHDDTRAMIKGGSGFGDGLEKDLRDLDIKVFGGGGQGSGLKGDVDKALGDADAASKKAGNVASDISTIKTDIDKIKTRLNKLEKGK